MADNNRNAIAQVYAQALFELAEPDNKSEEIREELEQFNELILQESEFSIFLDNPAIPREARYETIKKIFGDFLSGLTLDFLGVLNRKGRLGLLPETTLTYGKICDKALGFVEGTVTTAIELPDEEIQKLAEDTGKSMGRKVKLTALCDPAIIGGMILNVEGTLLDTSVRQSLRNINRKLKHKNKQLKVVAEYFSLRPTVYKG